MRQNSSYQSQLIRIKEKLLIIRQKDKKHKLFGAKSHLYQIGKPITLEEIAIKEQIFNISLPEDFKLFLTTIGNGGISSKHTAAAPYYGLYSLINLDFSELLPNPEIYLSQPTLFTQSPTQEEWENLKTTLLKNIGRITTEEYNGYYDINNFLYQGLLPISTQGCAYYTALILNGMHRGRVIYVDIDNFNPPLLVYENNFLDWYERWLDESIAGYNIGWFGRVIGGNEYEVWELYQTTKDKTLKMKYLWGLSKLPILQEQTINYLQQECLHTDGELADNAKEFLRLYELCLPKPWWKDNILYSTCEEITDLCKTIYSLMFPKP